MTTKMKWPARAAGQPFLDAQDWVRLYRWVGALALLLMTVLTPPFQVPDEHQHFYRSYQLSRLELRPEIREGLAGAMLPSTIPRFVEAHLGTLAHHMHHGREIPRRSWFEGLAALGDRLVPANEEFVEFSGSAMYAPLAYAPQAAAIAVGRALDWSPLALLLAARVANALAAFALVAWALPRLCAARATCVLLALLPMTLFMMASVSPDALTIAGGFVVAALMARFVSEGSWGQRDLALWVVGGLLLCTVKVVYIPLMFTGFAALMTQAQFRTRQLWGAVGNQTVGAVLVIALTAFWFWWRPSGISGNGFPPGVNPSAQLALLRESPLLVLQIVPRTFYMELMPLASSTIGRLGWLNVPLPRLLYFFAAIALALSLFLQGKRPVPSPGVLGSLWILLLAFVAVELITLAHYVAWTPVGSFSAKGVQGRYLLPVMPMVALALTWCIKSPPAMATSAVLRRVLIGWAAILPACAILTLVHAYWL